MAMRTPRLPVLLAIAAVFAGAIFILWRSSANLQPSNPGPTDTTATDYGLQWREGRSQQYQVDIDSSFVMTMPGASAGQTMNLLMAGLLEYRTLDTGTEGARVGMRFASVTLTIDGASDPQVNRALASPFRVRFDRNGRPGAFEFPTEMASEHRDILENLVRMFQVVIEGKTTWVAEEINGSGRYRASYTRSSPLEITKQKQSYFPSIPAGSAPEVKSTETILADPENDWITGMTLNETINIRDVGSVPVRVTNHATIKLVANPSQLAASNWNFASSAQPDTATDQVTAPPVMSHEEAQRRLMTNVEELDVAEEGRSRVIHRLRDLLAADDQLPGVLIETLRTEELSVRTRADLYLAFELAGTPASQAALTSVVADSSWPPEDAMRAIVALGGVSEPSGDTLASLWNLANTNLAGTERSDLPSTAALAIGSIGNSLRQNEEVDYAAVRADLLAGASGAVEPTERAVYLYALGNTADPDLVLKRDLVYYLDDPSSEVRSAAAKTLGRLGPDKVEAELMTRVRQEPNSQARASMLEALTSWEEPPAEAIEWAQQAIRQEADDQARYNMAVLLGNNMEDFPENRQILESLLASEQSKRVRQKVANILY